MAAYLSAIDTRIRAILFSGFDASTTEGAAHKITSGKYRNTIHNAPFSDEGIVESNIDRAIHLEWSSIEDTPNFAPINAIDPVWMEDLILRIQVGYQYGKASSAFAKTVGSETASAAVVNWRERAINDSREIYRALTWYEYWKNPVIDPNIVVITRQGASQNLEIAKGKAISDSVYRVSVASNGATSYSP